MQQRIKAQIPFSRASVFTISPTAHIRFPRHRMEFTEPIGVTAANPNSHTSAAQQTFSLAPNGRCLALGLYCPPFRKHPLATTAGTADLLPSWEVKVVDTESLGALGGFTLTLPEREDSRMPTKQTHIPSKSRQFVHTKTPGATGTLSYPARIGPQLQLLWSPDGSLLAAWPRDTAYIYVFHVSASTGIAQQLMRIDELGAVGIASLHWTPDSRGLLVNLSFGMGIKYWSLADSRLPLHLFPYPKTADSGIIDFSTDANFMAILHRREGLDHIAIYSHDASHQRHWHVVNWLTVPEDANLEGICFAKGMASDSDSLLLYAWESIAKFRLLIFNVESGELSREVDAGEILGATLETEPTDFDKFFGTFGLKHVLWSCNGRIAAIQDSQDQLYIWNAVIHRLMGQISLLHLEPLKAQNPIVFKEQVMKDAAHYDGTSRSKYEASYAFPLQSQLVSSSSPKPDSSLSCKLSWDGELLAVHHRGKYPCAVWIFDLKAFRLKALLLQLQPVTDFGWHQRQPLLTLCTGSDHVFLWQPEGTHCIPYPSAGLRIERTQWHTNAHTMLLCGPDACCLGNPDVLSAAGLVRDDSMTF